MKRDASWALPVAMEKSVKTSYKDRAQILSKFFILWIVKTKRRPIIAPAITLRLLIE